jgi:hypothetical protein
LHWGRLQGHGCQSRRQDSHWNRVEKHRLLISMIHLRRMISQNEVRIKGSHDSSPTMPVCLSVLGKACKDEDKGE